MIDIMDRGYSNPSALVSTEWVADHLNDKSIRIIESNEDQLIYSTGHIPGAVHVDWTTDLNDQVRRDYLDRKAFQTLMIRIGVTPATTVIFYGDKSNWWACYAYWVFQLFGHSNAKIMDGGRLKWVNEKRELTHNVPNYPKTKYLAPERDDKKIRAFRNQVLKRINKKNKLVDVRSTDEYTGKRLHMPEYPNEGSLRGGHIPNAKSIPWATAVNTSDGTFKTAKELSEIYEKENKLKPTDNIIVYCRIGERSSHTWFVMKNLLGFKKVSNYDGSWTEWGNLVGVPIEK
jgi:thiosulfate/3-mercaptopyruvate sulfurtransferase